MKVLILSFSSNQVNEDSYIPNKIGLTFSCVEECEKELKKLGNEVEHICINKKNIQKCLACGKRGWGICLEEHKCIQKDNFNEIYEYMSEFDAYIFITPVYFWEMSESAKTFFDRLKRCDAFNDNSKIKGKKFISIACAGGSGNGTENTLQAFDTLNHFMQMNMIGRIPVTKFNFEEQKQEISRCISAFDK
jgi:multimeric flavodoxin WrbA